MGSKASKCINPTSAYSPESTIDFVRQKSNLDIKIESENLKLQEGDSPTSLPYPTENTTSSSGTGNEVMVAFEQLFELCNEGNLKGLESLIEQHKDLQLMLNEPKYCTVSNIKMFLNLLQLAAAQGFHEIVAFLLQFQVVQPNIPDPSFGMTALHLAVYMGQTLVIEMLCKDARVDLREKNFDGKTALFLAIEKSYFNAIECIFRYRPRIDSKVKDFDGNTMLHVATTFPNERIMKMILHYLVSYEISVVQENNEEVNYSILNQHLKQYVEVSCFMIYDRSCLVFIANYNE